MPHWKTIFSFHFNKDKRSRSKPLNLFHLLCSCDWVLFPFSLFPPTDQQDKSNCLAAKKRMKGAPLWTEVSVEMPYTGWCSEISMKQHQRKQRDSSVLYKGPCELSKCLRSHYWQHFLPSKFSRGDLMASVGAQMQISSPVKWHEQSEKHSL